MYHGTRTRNCIVYGVTFHAISFQEEWLITGTQFRKYYVMMESQRVDRIKLACSVI